MNEPPREKAPAAIATGTRRWVSNIYYGVNGSIDAEMLALFIVAMIWVFAS